ncbi:Calmodulin-binding domain, plant [Dillenia turbinata]|uniref:Calmodulin-binding domain, plant n=1 Tax=Dillenia turbinata TaxID=194707 RepID=A0AAN8ZHW1_9MAGN
MRAYQEMMVQSDDHNSAATGKPSMPVRSSRHDQGSRNRGGAEPKKKLKKLKSIKAGGIRIKSLSNRFPVIFPDDVVITPEQQIPIKPLDESEDPKKPFQGRNESQGTSADCEPTATTIPLSQDQDGRKTGTNDPKKKMKKSRSIKRKGVSNRERSATQAKSRTDPPLMISSSEVAILPKPSPVKISNEMPNYLKPTSCFDAKKVQFKERPSGSESSRTSYAHKMENSKSATPKSTLSSQSSSTPFERLSSLKTAETLRKMWSLKSRKPVSFKTSPIPNEGVDRATCSSTLKRLKFPAHLELRQGGNASEEISVMEACPFSYCCFHGHHHAHAARPPLKHVTSIRRRMVKPQKSMKRKSVASQGEKTYKEVAKEPKKSSEVVQDQKNQDPATACISVATVAEEVRVGRKMKANPARGCSPGGVHEDINESGVSLDKDEEFDGTVPTEALVGGASYPHTRLKENLEQVNNSLTAEEEILQPPGDQLDMNLECGCIRSKAENSTSEGENEKQDDRVPVNLDNKAGDEDTKQDDTVAANYASEAGDEDGSHDETVAENLNDETGDQDRKQEGTVAENLDGEASDKYGNQDDTATANSDSGYDKYSLTDDQFDGVDFCFFELGDSGLKDAPSSKPGSRGTSSCEESLQEEHLREFSEENSDLKARNLNNAISTGQTSETFDTTICAEPDDNGGSDIIDTVPSASAADPLKEATGVNEQNNRNSEPHHALDNGPPSGALASDDATTKPSSTKHKHIRIWNMLYQNVLSDIGKEDKGQKLNGAEGKRRSNTIASPQEQVPDSLQGIPNVGHYVGKENEDAGRQRIKFRLIDAIRLIPGAIGESLIREQQDCSSGNQSPNTNTNLNEEPLKKDCGEGKEQTISTLIDTAEESRGKQDERKVGYGIILVPEETWLAAGNTISTEDEKTVLVGAKKPGMKISKNWSNLRKILLCRKFIKELGKERKFNPHRPRQIPLEPDLERESVNLRQQMMEQRKSPEEWMLDYAMRQAVTKLAQSRKKSVALLVEAFEKVKTGSENQSSQAQC